MRALVLVLLWCAPVFAQEVFPDPLAQARDLYEAGTKAYETGRYREALLAFDKAYRSVKLPTLLFNIAVCHEKLGQYREAVEHLRAYLATDYVKERDAVERKLAENEERLRLPHPQRPRPRPSLVQPLRRAVIAGGVSAAAIGITAGALSIAAAAQYSDLAERCPTSGCSIDDRDGLRRLSLGADVVWGIAAAAAVTTVVLHLVLRHERARQALHSANHQSWVAGIRF
jgi:tetratricopeptide (TPR) repeat protein